MKNESLLVVAKKYNDIYYALSLPEWRDSTHRILLIVTKQLSLSNYPMQEMFDEVHCIQPRNGTIGILQTLLELTHLLPKLNYSSVIISNISLVANKFIIASQCCHQAILIEDGYMNYYEFKEPVSRSKSLLMKLFGINQDSIVKKISKTYLLKPDIAEYYFGEKRELKIATDLFASKLANIPDLQGKRIFVGQPLYHTYTGNAITIDQYNEFVNKAICDLSIDFYVPHTMASDREHINCEKFDIGKYKCTFEILASLYDLEFYSVSSTILYSAKVVNPNCKSIMVQIPNVKKIAPNNILYKYSDRIIEL